MTNINNKYEEKINSVLSELKTKNTQITSSINYASRIQSAILPNKEFIELFPFQHFIFFKPRDIVSGDFYWMKKTNNKVIIAVADCTGHGVPGAFVSMLGIAFLNEIIAKKEVKTASEILEDLRTQIIQSLNQKGANAENKDGMDIAICIIDTDTQLLQYAGAYNPLYIVFNDENSRIEALKSNKNIKIHSFENSKSLIEIKATRSPIGIYINELPFVNNQIQLQKKDKLYMFSDGFVDQFGGIANTKYLSKHFRQLISKISKKPLNEQKQLFDSTLEEWKNTNEQNDDIIVMGIEIN